MRQAEATTVSIRSHRMSRTIKAKRYSTLAACIRRSIWNDIAHPLAVDRRRPGPKALDAVSIRSSPLEAFPIDSGVTAALALCAAFYAPEIQGDHQSVRYRPGAGHRGRPRANHDQ